MKLADDRVKELDAKRRGLALHGIAKGVTLAEGSRDHLKAKAAAAKVTDGWLEETEHHLNRAIEFLGPERFLGSVSVADMRRFMEHLLAVGLGGGTARHHLNAVSNLYRRAQGEGWVPPGFNPAAALMEKPSARKQEARWLEVYDAALLLESARLYQPVRAGAVPFTYPLLATFLLTGGHLKEVFGLEVDDISLDRKTVTFRWHEHRRLKNSQYRARVVPLWPQLEAALREWFPLREQLGEGKLLFPSFRAGSEAMLGNIRKTLSSVAQRAGWEAEEITPKMFRHTYCAARLQTLDQGAPVSPFTVGRELGHGGDSLVKRVYGHLGTVRHRAAVVEYLVEQHAEKLGERLKALWAAPGWVE